MHDLESLLKESRPVIEGRAAHRQALEASLRSAARPAESMPLVALVMPVAAVLLVMLTFREPNRLVLPEERLRAEWSQPAEGLQPMAWMDPAPLRGYVDDLFELPGGGS